MKKKKYIVLFVGILTFSIFTSTNFIHAESNDFIASNFDDTSISSKEGEVTSAVNINELSFSETSDGRGYVITAYTGTQQDLELPSEYNGKPVLEIADRLFSSKNLTSVTLPKNLEKIGMSAFSQNNLTSITLPETLTDLGGSCFLGNALTSIKIPTGVTSIESSVFKSNLLASIEFHENLTTIGYQSFQGNNLTSINLPSSLTNIEDWAFNGNKLTTVIFPENLDHIGYSAFGNNVMTGEIIIPASVTWIESSAFVNNYITHVTMNMYPKNLERGAFSYNGVMGVTLPKDISVINTSAFESETAFVTAVKTEVNQWEINLKNADPKLDSEKVKFTKPSIGIRYDQTTGILYATDYAMDKVMTYQYYISKGRNLAIPEVRLIKEKSYLVVFNDSDGTEISRKIVKSGEAATSPTPPIKDGATFIGWDKSFDNISDYTVVTAQYSIDKYTVKFESNGGSIVDKIEGIEHDSLIIAPVEPTRENFIFTGWYKDKELTQLWDFDKGTINSDMTLYAKWEKITDPVKEIYIVNFEFNGGLFRGVENPTFTTSIFIDGERLIRQWPYDTFVTKAGYKFTGWYSDQSCTIKWNFANDKVNSDMTLYAGWQKIDIPPILEKPKPDVPSTPTDDIPQTGDFSQNDLYFKLFAISSSALVIGIIYIKRKKRNHL